ncbi:Uncharacterized protein DAT39_011404 [Clarias magur]|uniref:Uncharacterized protein n=1 Tax=Clarias magur TaxID=1594786 RepID=A0A8J4UMI9_CLAMG|nr:Uncharacterized protein DAT39_011404 [Clarias magur]
MSVAFWFHYLWSFVSSQEATDTHGDPWLRQTGSVGVKEPNLADPSVYSGESFSRWVINSNRALSTQERAPAGRKQSRCTRRKDLAQSVLALAALGRCSRVWCERDRSRGQRRYFLLSCRRPDMKKAETERLDYCGPLMTGTLCVLMWVGGFEAVASAKEMRFYSRSRGYEKEGMSGSKVHLGTKISIIIRPY